MNTRKYSLRVSYAWVILLVLFFQPVALGTPLPLVAQDTTITVNTTADDFVLNGNCTLREAIIAVNTASNVDSCLFGQGVDTILVPAGTYILDLPPTEDDPKSGDLDIQVAVTIRGVSPEQTILDGNLLDRVFHIHNLNGSVMLENMTIRNGRASFQDSVGGLGEGRYGGGIFSVGRLILTQVHLIQNGALSADSTIGGGIFSQAPLTIINSVISNNESDNQAGGIYATGLLTIQDSIISNNFGMFTGGIESQETRISNSIISENTCLRGIAGIDATDLTLTNSTVIQNELSDPSYPSGVGGVAAGTLVIDQSVIANNIGTEGGGISIGEGGSATIVNTTIRDNHASQRGGGIYNKGATVTITGSTISGNSTTEFDGGGIHSLAGTLNITNSTISGNHANWSGGGLYQHAGTTNLKNVTIANNITNVDLQEGPPRGNGGGLAVAGGVVEIQMSILGGNMDLSQPDIHPDCSSLSGGISSKGYNLVSQADGCNWMTATGDQIGTIANPINPFIGSLANNGGPTFTHALLPGSPAIDFGTNSTCPPVDQRGQKRPTDGNGDGNPTCDIGAFEAPAQEMSDYNKRIYIPLITR
jgi:CSLREA domain-containing protein